MEFRSDLLRFFDILIKKNRSFLKNYTVEITPGADMALMLMIVMCLHELTQKKGGGLSIPI